jgi:hypothetical protein
MSHVSHRNTQLQNFYLRNIPKLAFLDAVTAYTPLTFCLLNHLQPTKSIYMGPVQGLNPNRMSISGLEPEMPVTVSKREQFSMGMFPLPRVEHSDGGNWFS